MDVYKELVQRPNTFTGANFQCAFGDGDRRSPTRWTGNLDGLQDFCYLGMPKVNAQGVYTGPLPTNCGHRHSQTTVGKGESSFPQTVEKSAYSVQ